MVDTKSFELAQHFLDGFDGVNDAKTMQLAQVIQDAVQLAQVIQDAVEDWITDAEHEGEIIETLDPDRLREDQQDREAQHGILRDLGDDR